MKRILFLLPILLAACSNEKFEPKRNILDYSLPQYIYCIESKYEIYAEVFDLSYSSRPKENIIGVCVNENESSFYSFFLSEESLFYDRSNSMMFDNKSYSFQVFKVDDEEISKKVLIYDTDLNHGAYYLHISN